MIRRTALMTGTAALALVAGPAAASADAASAPAAAKRAAVSFQHAAGKGQAGKACALLTPTAVKFVVQQASKPTGTSCAAALPAYLKYLSTSFKITKGKLAKATYTSASANGSSAWLVTTNAATTGVTRSGGAWKVSVAVAIG